MPANRDKKTGKWNCQFYYTDWTGKKVKKMKRGFETKKEAQDWERHFKLEKASSLDMTFGDFYRRYEADVKPKVRENTWQSKVWVIEKKILPYFKDLVMRDITPRDVLAWQNEMRKMESKDGNSFKGTYLRKMQAELSAIFNHAVKYYELPKNPAVIAGPLGQHNADEMLFWTKEEYMRFIPTMANKTYMELIRENIDYDIMMSNPKWLDRDMYEELYQLICDVVCVPRKTIRIAGEDYPYSLVKSKFLKLNSTHLEYVIGCMKNNTTKVSNIKAYLTTALYNAPNTINHYYTAEVNHDMYGTI